MRVHGVVLCSAAVLEKNKRDYLLKFDEHTCVIIIYNDFYRLTSYLLSVGGCLRDAN